MKFTDQEHFIDINLGHRWILRSTKQITPLQHAAWMIGVIKERIIILTHKHREDQ